MVAFAAASGFQGRVFEVLDGGGDVPHLAEFFLDLDDDACALQLDLELGVLALQLAQLVLGLLDDGRSGRSAHFGGLEAIFTVFAVGVAPVGELAGVEALAAQQEAKLSVWSGLGLKDDAQLVLEGPSPALGFAHDFVWW
jgi:hypothetical protein